MLLLAAAPRGPLLAALDTLGRVSLLSSTHMGVLRMWKVCGGRGRGYAL